VTNNPGSFTNNLFGPKALPDTARWLRLILWVAIVAALFCQLGTAALFEPDEGRNAEKAREILVLSDWVTPHESFHAVLDKPIFFYWLIAIAYKLFGISEWAARLPSALAALGCIALIYRFAHARWGRWTALWSALILLTSVEFFILSRVVIFDMTLSFFLTLALCAFYEATHTEEVIHRRIWCIALYMALGAATLTKGLVGFVVPGMIMLFYLLLRQQWAALRRMNLIPGALSFVAIVLPWYVMAEGRNPGYLYYYLWDEHFGRFATGEFNRGEPWYYFIIVCLVGFLPWTVLLPLAAKITWKTAWTKKLDDTTLYVILWAVLPFLFFSVSRSKLPHYILPIFPPLAMLMAAALVRQYQESSARLQFALSFTWWIQLLAAMYLLSGWVSPSVLPQQIRSAVGAMPYFVWIYTALTAVMLVYMAKQKTAAQPRSQHRLYVVQAFGVGFFLALVVKMMVLISPERSAKAMAEVTRPKLTATAQVVQFDTYLAGLSFYLQSERPLWLVTRDRKKRTFLGNYYAIGKKSDPSTAWGPAILSFQEFLERWRNAKQPLLIIVKEKNLGRLAREVGESPLTLGAVDEYLLVSKR
jgi:4-amino-4-deoxy-L-arabinose transferase-like glycosyltransferase